jgi:hypothetical protein
LKLDGLHGVKSQKMIPSNVNEVVGFEVLTAVVVKNTIFWDITPCSPLNASRCFGITYRLNLQGRRTSRARNPSESRWQAEQALKMEAIIPPKRLLTFNGLHGVITQKIVLFYVNDYLLKLW